MRSDVAYHTFSKQIDIDAHAFVAGFVLQFEAAGDSPKVGPSLIELNAGLETRQRIQLLVVAPIHNRARSEAERRPQLSFTEKKEAGRHNTDHRVADSVDRDTAAHQVRIGVESARPQIMPDHDDRLRALLVFLGPYRATVDGTDSERLEETGGHLQANQPLRFAPPGQVHAAPAESGHPLADLVLLAVIDEVRIRDRHAGHTPTPLLYQHKLFWLRIR